MSKEIPQFVSGLKPYKKDTRDFKFEKVFGIATDIPEFFYEPLSVKNQYNTDFCVGFSLTEVAEYLDKIELDPLWFYSRIKEIEGNYLSYGADFKTAGKASVSVGFSPQVFAPYKITEKDRNFLANPENYDDDLKITALPYRKKSYFFVQSGFQSTISAMYNNKTPVMVGCDWCNEWMYQQGGIINSGGVIVGQHAMKACGWKYINGKRYIGILNSYGKDVGDNGIFWFAEDIYNKYFKMTPMVIVDLSPTEAKQLSWSNKVRLYDLIIKTMQSLILKLNELYSRTIENAGLNP